MSKKTSKSYTITDANFKKTARKIQQKIINSSEPGVKVSLQSIMQILSNELFSTPYEEAKKVTLSSSEKPPQILNKKNGSSTPGNKLDLERLLFEIIEKEKCGDLAYLSSDLIGHTLVNMTIISTYIPSALISDFDQFQAIKKKVDTYAPLLLSKLANIIEAEMLIQDEGSLISGRLRAITLALSKSIRKKIEKKGERITLLRFCEYLPSGGLEPSLDNVEGEVDDLSAEAIISECAPGMFEKNYVQSHEFDTTYAALQNHLNKTIAFIRKAQLRLA